MAILEGAPRNFNPSACAGTYTRRNHETATETAADLVAEIVTSLRDLGHEARWEEVEDEKYRLESEEAYIGDVEIEGNEEEPHYEVNFSVQLPPSVRDYSIEDVVDLP